MITISVDEMERDTAGYLRRVEAGETLILVRADKPVAEVKPVKTAAQQKTPDTDSVRKRRPFGLCAGEFTVPADFDAPLSEDILRAFEGE